MSRLREIKRRIKSVQSIGQVTHAMELVAASRMRRAQENAKRGRAFVEKTKKVLVRVANAHTSTHELLAPQVGSTSTLIIVFSPQRGLAGGLPWNLLRYVHEVMDRIEKEGQIVRFITVGKKLRDQISRLGHQIDADFSDVSEHPTTADIRHMAKFIRHQYLTTEVRRVLLIFPQYVNAIKQQSVSRILLPLTREELIAFADPVEKVSQQVETDFVFEPSEERIIDELVRGYIESQLYQAKLETVASEYSARVVAMKNASDNAHELQFGLTLDFNKSRQAQITSELAEITGGGL